MENTTISEQIITFFTQLDGHTAYAAIVGILFACGLGLPIPEDITLISAGVLASMGTISVHGAHFVGYIGVLLGDTLLFFIGRKFGKRAFTLPVFNRIFTTERVVGAERRIQANARLICFVARFLPGLRAPIYLTAGVMGVRPSIFLTQDGLAALISVPLWVHLGYVAGNNMDKLINLAKQYNIYFLIGVAALVVIFFLFKKLKKRYLPQV